MASNPAACKQPYAMVTLCKRMYIHSNLHVGILEAHNLVSNDSIWCLLIYLPSLIMSLTPCACDWHRKTLSNSYMYVDACNLKQHSLFKYDTSVYIKELHAYKCTSAA